MVPKTKKKGAPQNPKPKGKLPSTATDMVANKLHPAKGLRGNSQRVNSSASPSFQSKSMGSLGPGNGSSTNYKADKGQIMANSNIAIVLYYT